MGCCCIFLSQRTKLFHSRSRHQLPLHLRMSTGVADCSADHVTTLCDVYAALIHYSTINTRYSTQPCLTVCLSVCPANVGHSMRSVWSFCPPAKLFSRSCQSRSYRPHTPGHAVLPITCPVINWSYAFHCDLVTYL